MIEKISEELKKIVLWRLETIPPPLKDKVAHLFLQPSNELVVGLLRGKSAREAAEIFNNLSKKNIIHLLGKQDEPGAMASAMLLWNNMMAQEVLENKEMRFL